MFILLETILKVTSTKKTDAIRLNMHIGSLIVEQQVLSFEQAK